MTATQSQIRDALAVVESNISQIHKQGTQQDLEDSLPFWKTIRTILQSALDTQKPAGDAALVALSKIIDTLEAIISDIKPGVLSSGPVKEILETTVIRIDSVRHRLASDKAPSAVHKDDSDCQTVHKSLAEFITDRALPDYLRDLMIIKVQCDEPQRIERISNFIVKIREMAKAALAGKPKDSVEQALNGDCGGGDRKFKLGDRVRKIGNKGQWHGHVVGFYSASCTPIGYAIESELETGSVQIYPESALEALTADNAKRGDNTAADTKMGDALSHDNAELGKVGDIFDKLTQYAEDSIGCQYGTLSADLVEKLAKEGLAIIDRLMGVKG